MDVGERVLRVVAFVALFAFVCLAWFLYEPAQWPAPVNWRTLAATPHPCGPLGLLAAHGVVLLFGRVFSILVAVSLGVFGLGLMLRWSRKRILRLQTRIVGVALLGMAMAELVAGDGAGGLLGRLELHLLSTFLGRIGTTILMAAIGGWILLRVSSPLTRPVLAHSGAVRARLLDVGHVTRGFWVRMWRDLLTFWQPTHAGAVWSQPARPATTAPEAPPPAAGASAPDAARVVDVRRSTTPRVVVPALPAADVPRRVRAKRDAWELPGIDLLHDIPAAASVTSDKDLLRLSRVLEEKLADFGIGGRVSEVQPGPVITTYEFEPAPGIKVSQVTSRVDDLAMALRAQAIRMVAPIPGKAAIGIEIPNESAQVVGLREIMASWSSSLSVGALGLALGRTVSGDPFFADLTGMPHLLVAGATGSGKSVCINVLLCSLLLRHDPTEVKLLLIDPKMLELNAYHDIPHLLHPVVTDPKEAYKALHWMTLEMERRYRELAKASVRNIVGYNNKVRSGELRDADSAEPVEPLPYVVVIVDELADLMIQVGREIETPIARLAQMARAVGIHLVLATQRPSVDVITGVIKANFPSRIAFQVSSRVDSRTILDCNGAETLLGRGDMLFLPGGRPAPIRVHGAFVSVEECERIAAHWRAFGQDPGRLDLDGGRGGADLDASGDDDLFMEARRLVVTSGVASVSYLQRRLKVGYSRAARIMDMLEEAGVVGPTVGAKPREILERLEDLPQPID